VTPSPEIVVMLTGKDRTFGEIDVLFEHKIPARKFKYTKADREFTLRDRETKTDEM